MFSHPYSKIALVERDLNVSRATATRYLDELTRIGLMDKLKLGRESYYLNRALVDLLTNVQSLWSAGMSSQYA
jgi:DNA-binding IclR family transcriptional regulator